MKTLTTALLALVLLCESAFGATVTNVTLTWNGAATATGYRLYQSTGTASFANIMSLSGTTASVSGVPTDQVTRWYVTGFNPAAATTNNPTGEGPASNVVTNQPVIPPPPGTLGISLPALSSRTAVRGATITGQAQFTNGWAVPVLVNEGWLTARQPGASNQSGPFDDWSPGMPSQTVPPGGIVTLTASWVVRADAPFGVWTAHLAVKVDGSYHDGPSVTFTVMDVPVPPPPAPTNLRVSQVTRTRLDVSWDGSLLASTEVERRVEMADFKRVATIAPGTLHYSDSNIRRHRDYGYRVRQRNTSGAGPYSEVATYQAP